jgi:competence protein ComEA
MIDDFLYKNRYWIGGGLIAVIILGLGVIGWNKYQKISIARENSAISQLKQENEQLRAELSSQTRKIAGTATLEVAVTGKININQADLAELDKIPGIGPARAADIINYRQSHGGFKTIEEIKNIKGIGDKTFESMKDLISVGD